MIVATTGMNKGDVIRAMNGGRDPYAQSERQVVHQMSWVNGMFDDAFKAINGKPWPVDVMNLYPFNVRVLVFRDIGPRAPRFEEIVDIGKGLIEAVVERKPIAYASLAFVFPERWLSVRECQAFMNSLAHNPCAEDGTIKEVSILTNSCVMITDFMSEQIAVMHG